MCQILARILRRSGNLQIPRHIIDVVDIKTPVSKQLIKRMAAYRFYNMNIKTTKISYNLMEQHE